MAAAEEKKDSTKTNSEQTPNHVNEKPKRDILGMVLVFLFFINLCVIGAMGYFMLQMWERINVLQQEGIAQFIPPEPQEEVAVGKALEPKNLGVLYPLEPFLVNLPSDAGPRFLQTQIEFELSDPSVEDELSMKKAAVRDAIIVLLTSRTYETLREPAGMTDLRTTLQNTVNQLLNTGSIKRVYFTQFHFN